jgi:hypothetical protein
MEFDPTHNTYQVTDEEAALFGLPEGTHEWPNADAATLLRGIERCEESAANMDVTAVSPPERPHMLHVQARRAKVAREARHLLAAHMAAELSDDDLARLADGEL